MNDKILFLCPHGAAKSVMAAAYFRQLAAQRGLSIEADSAGTDPDVFVSPAVAEMLKAEGMDVSGSQPRRVTQVELAEAYQVISLGCDLADLGAVGSKVEQWDDVPPPSQDLLAARNTIRSRVEQLIVRLLHQQESS